MITEEEKTEIINMAVEKALLLIPETVGNLMKEHAVLSKINKKFYSDYPEFKSRTDVVQAVIEQIDGEDPTRKYEEILKLAVPKIRDRIKTMEGLNMTSVQDKINRDFSNGEL